MDKLLPIENGVAVARSRIPRVDFACFQQTVTELVRCNGYIVQLFAYVEREQTILLAVLRTSNLFVLETEVADAFPSLTLAGGPKFNLFEREIAEQYGIRPTGHPWLKMVRYHANHAGRPDVFGNDYRSDIPGQYQYFRIEGETIHEVGVGPVHAGIIEPGHFRFQCAGEKVLHLEIQLGYQHRGVERMLTQAARNRIPGLCEAIAGDTAIGHGLCYAQAIEALAGVAVAGSARTVRTIALELERIANHIGDLGALSGDVAFNPPAAYFGRIRGEFLNLLLTLSGNRFGKGLVRPGGITLPMANAQRANLLAKMIELRPEIEHVCDLLFSAHTVQGRFESTGTVSRPMADQLGLVGPCGRASGLEYDVREFFPTERYADLPGNTNRMTKGDVLSRAMVRREEIMHSLDLIQLLLDEPGTATHQTPPDEPPLAPDRFVVTLNEGWRGEVSHCLLTNAQGLVCHHKVKDPSFHNWSGLAMALRDQEISDFPLCNKSFNLSYCGFDL